MKTKYPLITAIAFVLFMVSSLGAAVTPLFDLPKDVIKATTPDKKDLPRGLSESRGPTYEEMMPMIARTKYGEYGGSISIHYHMGKGMNAVIVINGQLVQARKKGQDLGVALMLDRPAERGELPVPFDWFKRYGDPMIIGVFQLGPNNVLTNGRIYGVRLADLVVRDGFRKVSIYARDAQPVSQLKVEYVKPNRFNSPMVKMKMEPKVTPNEGVAVAMDPFVVAEAKAWADVRGIADSTGKVIALDVVSVREGKPFAEAGLKAGMIIRRYSVLPLKEGEEFRTSSGWAKGDIILEVSDDPHKSKQTRTIVIPAESLRKAVPIPKGDTVAAASE